MPGPIMTPPRSGSSCRLRHQKRPAPSAPHDRFTARSQWGRRPHRCDPGPRRWTPRPWCRLHPLGPLTDLLARHIMTSRDFRDAYSPAASPTITSVWSMDYHCRRSTPVTMSWCIPNPPA